MDIYLDVDRTLFNTDLFDELRWSMLRREYSVDTQERARQKRFFVHNDGMYYYDFFAHMKDIGLEPREVYSALSQSELGDGRLEYKGVSELISWIRERGTVRLLTYGADDYQRLKVALCPSLENLEIIATRRGKGHFFRKQPMQEGVWMVDDKPIGDELPDSVNFIQAVEYNDIVPPHNISWHVARSPEEVQILLAKM